MLHVHVTCYLLLVTCLDIANIYIPLWEDSQWYAIKTYVRSGRGLPGFDTGEMKNWKNMLLRGLYIILTCTYHCERIHSGISCTCVRSGRGLPDLTLGRWKWRNYITDSYMLHVLYIASMYIPLWEDSQWYAIKTYVRSGRGLPGFDTGEMENWRNLLLIVLYINFDMYVPLWEDSQWYIMKPTSDLAEDCQVWRWGGIMLWIGHIYMSNVGRSLWEDSQWYIMKPTSDLAEDCQVWRWGGIMLWIGHTYMSNVGRPLWEDSQWYIMKPTSDLAEDCQV
jgi:hypothetical protein